MSMFAAGWCAAWALGYALAGEGGLAAAMVALTAINLWLVRRAQQGEAP